MQYEIVKGNQSNFVITLHPVQENLEKAKEKVLKQFQKDMTLQGFRKWHVPLDMVEKNTQPMMLQMWVYEQIVHMGTKIMLDDHKDKKFIWMIYDLQPQEKEWKTTFTFKLDVYPEVIEKNNNWSSLSIDAYDKTPSKEEIDQTLNNLKKQYAQYEPATSVSEWTLFKSKFSILDGSWLEIDSGTVFLGKEDVEEFPIILEIFAGKELNEEFEITYDKATLPIMLQVKHWKDDTNAKVLKLTVIDIRTVILPEFTDENIKKFFWWADVKSEEDLINQISDAIWKQKEESLLMKSVDSFLTSTQESFDIIIPKTLVEEELKSRMKSMSERYNGEEWLKAYFEKLGEEKENEIKNEISTASKMSLEKFFLLRKVVESLDLWVEEKDWSSPLSVEKKLYEKMVK